MKRLFIDMDGTLARFREADTLEILYEKGYFASLEPQKNVIDAVKVLMKNERDMDIYILSAYLTDSKYALEEKNEWLDKYLPDIRADKRIFLPCGENKKDYVPSGLSKKDYLLDDYTKNLLNWDPPGNGIKLINDINGRSGVWKKKAVKYSDGPISIALKIKRIVEAITMNDVKKVNLIATYEEQHGINDAERVTEYFGDYGGFFLKHNVDEEKVNSTYKKALDAINMTDEDFLKNDDFLYRRNIDEYMKNILGNREMILEL